MKKLFTILMAALLCISASAQIAQDAYNKWHQNKYSMFIHFGLYSMPARHEWIKSYEMITEEKYEKYFRYFNPDLFETQYGFGL